MMATRPDGFQHLSLDASARALDALSAAGVRARLTDPEHADIHKDATLVGRQLLQVRAVDEMRTTPGPTHAQFVLAGFGDVMLTTYCIDGSSTRSEWELTTRSILMVATQRSYDARAVAKLEAKLLFLC